MFSRSQSNSKRSGGQTKLNKQRPSIELTAPSASFSASGPSLAFSPVNIQARSPDALLPKPATSMGNMSMTSLNVPLSTDANHKHGDSTPNLTLTSNLSNTNLAKTGTPTTGSSNQTTPNVSTNTLPMLPSIRSFTSRFASFGSKSASHKKAQASISASYDIIAGEDDVLEINHVLEHTGDRSLDPSALRSPDQVPSLTLPANLHDPLTLPRTNSQHNMPNNLASKKRKSFDFAGLSGRPTASTPVTRSKSPDFGIGLGRPSFSSVRGLGVSRAFTPNGSAIREAVSEDEGNADTGGVQSPQPRRSFSFDSPHSPPEPADVTRVIDLSMGSPDVNGTPPTGSTRFFTDSQSPYRSMKQDAVGPSSISPLSSGSSFPRPNATSNFASTLSPIAQSVLDMSPEGHLRRPLGPPAFSTNSPLKMPLSLDSSFVSSHFDVEAMEASIEARLGRDFVGNLLEGEEEPSDVVHMTPATPSTPLGSIEEGNSSQEREDDTIEVTPRLPNPGEASLDFGQMDPNLASLLSPNNLLSNLPPQTTSTPSRGKPAASKYPLTLNIGHPKNNPRFRLSSEDVTLTPGMTRSPSEATSAGGLGPITPLSAPGNLPPPANGSVPGGLGNVLLTAGFPRSRSRTPTPPDDQAPSSAILLTPTKRDSASSTSSYSSAPGTYISPAQSNAASSTNRVVSGSRRPLPAPLAMSIPDPLPPPRVSPDTPVFQVTTRRATVTSPDTNGAPTSPIIRERSISVSDGTSPLRRDGKKAPDALVRRLPFAGTTRRGSTDPDNAESRAMSPKPNPPSRISFDQPDRIPRPATVLAHRRFATGSPDIIGATAGPSTLPRGNEDATGELPLRAVTSLSYNRNVSAPRSSIEQTRPQPSSFIREPRPPVSGTMPNTIRKRRSYSIDAGVDRTKFFASLGYRGRGEYDQDDLREVVGTASPDLAASGRFDSMSPFTKRTLGQVGLLGGENSGRHSSMSTSRTYPNATWKAQQTEEVRPPLPRSNTLSEFVPRHFSKDSVSTAEHPSTPSSASGPSRTLYAPSTTSSGPGNVVNGRGSTPSPVPGTTSLPPAITVTQAEISSLKERHEIEKEALLSSLTEMKRDNSRLSKEKEGLMQYIAELEERLAKAEDLNRKTEQLRMMAAALSGGYDLPSTSEPHSRPGSSRQRNASPLRKSVLPSRLGESTSTRPGKSTRRPRTADSADTPQTPTRPIAAEETMYLNPSAALSSKERKANNRLSGSEASVLLPTMSTPREMSLLLNELPPPNQYATSSIADESRPPSPLTNLTRKTLKHLNGNSPTAPSFSFYNDDQQSVSSEGSLRLRLEDELHLADLVSMGPMSDHEDADSVF